MTPTPEQLADVLPRCQAGLEGGDWSEDDERLKWATRALHYVKLAIDAERKVAMAQALNAPEPAEHWHFGDDLYCEDCRPLNDWPPPTKGDHESECGVEDPAGCLRHKNPWCTVDGCPGGFHEYNDGVEAWRRSR